MADQPTGDDSSFLPNWIRPFFDHPGITFGALIAAVVIWFYIRGKVEGELRVTAQLNLRVEQQENQKYIITGKKRNAEEVEDKLKIRLRGPRSQLERIKEQKMLIISKTISVDNEDLDTPVKVNITDNDLELRNRAMPFGIHMVESETLEVTVQRIVEETRTLSGDNLEKDRERFTINDPADGYQILDVVPQVNSVTMKGPEQMVAETRIVPESKIDVSGKASDFARQVSLTTDPYSEHISLSVQNVAITVNIESELTEKKIEKQFRIAMGPELSAYLQERNWNLEPSDRMVTITFKYPKSIESQLLPKNIYPILILPEDEEENIQDPTVPSAVSSEDFLRIILDQSIPERTRVDVVNIKPERITFVPIEEEQ